MRTREEIAINFKDAQKTKDQDFALGVVIGTTLEVLLDIRDLLTPEKPPHFHPYFEGKEVIPRDCSCGKGNKDERVCICGSDWSFDIGHRFNCPMI